MSTAANAFGELASATAARLEGMLDAFEDAWKQGCRPQIEAYLPADPAERCILLVELVHLDLEYRFKAGEPARVEDYCSRYPELAGDHAAGRELIAAEFALRRDHEPHVALEEYRVRFPQYGPELLAGLEPTPAPRRRLGKYELLDLVGQGAFGLVYRARDSELDRLVALKVPRAGSLASEAEVDRFVREARSAARLRHPHLVAAHDAGQVEGTCYLVSEFILGTTLADRLRGGRLPARQAAELLAAVADALDYAHQHGVIHRDLKPSNILLDAEGRPHLTDFGLARWAAAECTLTLEGEPLGTPAYMPPEQARGEAHRVDARSDVYSLGVVLYEVLTGELPFRGNSRMVLRQVLEEEPRPPRRLHDDIPRDLERICLRAMTKEPGGRYATAAALADDLRRFLEGRPVQARPLGMAGKLGRWCRRRPLVAGLTAAVLAVAVAGFAGVTWQWRLARQHLAQAEQNFARAEQSFARAHQAVSDLLNVCSTDPALRNADFQPVRAELAEKALRYYESFVQERQENPDLLMEVIGAHNTLGGLYSGLGARDKLLQTRQKICELADRLVALHPAVAPYQHIRADAYLQLGMAQRAQRQAAEARQALERAGELFASYELELPADYYRRWGLAASQIQLGCLYRDTGEPEKAGPCAEHARHVIEAPDWQDAPDGSLLEALARQLPDLAVLQDDLGRHAGALGARRRAIDLVKTILREHPAPRSWPIALPERYRLLGCLYRTTGQDALARDAYQTARDLFTQLCRETPTDARLQHLLRECSYDLFELHRDKGQVAEAVRMLEASCQTQEDLVQRAPADRLRCRQLARSLHQLGIVQRNNGQPVEALQAHQRADLLLRKLAREAPSDIDLQVELTENVHYLARAQDETAHTAEAFRLYREASELWQQLLQQRPRDERLLGPLAVSYHCLGNICSDTDRAAEAVGWYHKAIALWEQLCRERPTDLGYHNNVKGSWEGLGEVLEQLGRREEAIQAYEHSAAHLRFLVTHEPGYSKHRYKLSGCYHRLARLHRELGRLPEAVAAVLQAKALWPDEPVELCRAAWEVELCAQAVGGPQGKLGLEQHHQRRHYTGNALGFLRDAGRSWLDRMVPGASVGRRLFR